MRRPLLILISLWLLPLTLNAQAHKVHEDLHDLESDALSMWLLRDADESTRVSIATSMTGQDEPDQDALNAARKQLDETLAQFDDNDRFVLRRVVSWQEWDKKASHFTLKHALPENNLLLRNPFFPSIRSGALPGYLVLILPNYQMTHTLPMDPHAASAYLDSRRDQSDFHRQRLFLEIHMKPEAFQQGQYVQMVIEKIDVFDHKKTRNLIATLHEKRKPSAVVADSLLSNGVTSKAIPIHNFTIHGIRMLEILGEYNPTLGTCRQTDPSSAESPHRHVQCVSSQTTRGVQYQQRLEYIGGRLDSIHLSTDTAPDEKTLATWSYTASREFGLPLEVTQPVRWSKHGITLNYDPQRLIEGDESAPFLVVRATQSHDGT